MITGIYPCESFPQSFVEDIKASKHFGQLRVMIVDLEGNDGVDNLDMDGFHDMVMVPLIILNGTIDYDSRFMFEWMNKIVTPKGVTEETARRILDCCLVGHLDLLRVTHLILGNPSFDA